MVAVPLQLGCSTWNTSARTPPVSVQSSPPDGRPEPRALAGQGAATPLRGMEGTIPGSRVRPSILGPPRPAEGLSLSAAASVVTPSPASSRGLAADPGISSERCPRTEKIRGAIRARRPGLPAVRTDWPLPIRGVCDGTPPIRVPGQGHGRTVRRVPGLEIGQFCTQRRPALRDARGRKAGHRGLSHCPAISYVTLPDGLAVPSPAFAARRRARTSTSRFWRSAWETPGMRPACARSAGRTRASFSRASALRVSMAP